MSDKPAASASTPPAWHGATPRHCDGCRGPIRLRFCDMASRSGAWGIFCPTCAAFEIGFREWGPGVGQKYQYDTDSGQWLKVKG